MVKLPQTVLEELKRHLRQQLELKLKLGPAYSDGGFVCGWEDGRPFNPDWLNRAFRRLLAHFGLPPIRFHDLRHTHATLLLREGVPVKVIAERLGHSTTSFTQDIYSHVLPEMQDRAAVFDQLMKKEK